MCRALEKILLLLVKIPGCLHFLLNLLVQQQLVRVFSVEDCSPKAFLEAISVLTLVIML